eukprot:TRINITY_DN3817_c0_g1_i2.p1 TRINITY_DN3817_c0_g1~~TRINITY_DN3817_c0_g1_i2.p1  ORF type:complete len:361 (-),score=121.45 TRINITY_DN3817_c0_g1_i2:909-1949(-)
MASIQLENGDLKQFGNHVLVLDFWAEWCKPCVQLNSIFDQLAASYHNLKFVKVDAEKFEELTERFEVNAVPTFLFVKAHKVLDRIEGASPAELAQKVASYSKAHTAEPAAAAAEPAAASAPGVELNTRLHQLINQAPVMLFMKGTPAAPACGFSSKIVKLLQDQGVTSFGHFNILSDEQVRSGLKVYSNWPTFPQLYVDGKLVGGLDIVTELIEQDEFKPMLAAAATPPPAASAQAAAAPAAAEDLQTRLTKLINRAPVMLFMKGHPSAPKCGFSSKIVDIIKSFNIPFDSFDILNDEEVRQGLKTLSNWPTYPQLYVNGKLVGGLDIVKEYVADGQFEDVLKGNV